MSKIKVLAIDGSTTSTGIAIFDNLKLIYYECIAPSGKTLDRIEKITNRIKILYEQYEPNRVIMEQVLPDDVKHNQKTYKALIYLQAAIVLELNKKKQKVEFYVASHWRKLCNMKLGPEVEREELKQASKDLIKQKYNIDVNDDISDAILIGKAYLQQNGSAF